MAHCIQRVPLQPLNQNQNDPTIQCQMCNCATFESYLRKHIQYNHMIHRRNIVDILYKLHYPAEIYGVQTQTANTWVTDLSLAPLEHAGCFRDDPHIIQKKSSNPVKDPVLCSVCGEIESEMMIACDKCDGWYHWKCVGITEDPLPNDVWFCSHCINTETEDNLPAEESLPVESSSRSSCALSQEQSAFRTNSSTQATQSSRKNVTVEGQKFSESQILIRERAPERNTYTRGGRSSKRDENIETNANIPQPSTSQLFIPENFFETNIQDIKKDEEEPFTEVVRRKRKKRSNKLEIQNRIVVTTEIDKDDTTPEESIEPFDAFEESNFDDFDIGNDQLNDMSADELDELDEFQEQKHDIFSSEAVDSEKPKLKILNTFSINMKGRNPKSTRLGKRKEKKIGLHKIHEIIPSARKPLKILVGGKQVVPTDATNEKHTETKMKKKGEIFREYKSPIKSPIKTADTIINKSEVVETLKGKGKGKGKRGQPKITHPENETIKVHDIQDQQTSSSGKPHLNDIALDEGKELKVELSRLSNKVIEEKTNEAKEIHTAKSVNKLKIKRLSTVTKKKQNKKYEEDSEEEFLNENFETNVPKFNEKGNETTNKQSNTSLFDLTPFLYRIHKGRRQKMRVHLNNRNNKMRLSKETIDCAKNYYLKTPEDWEQRQVYMNNQYMQLKCFKFIGDEYAPVVKNYKKTNKKKIGPQFWKTLNRSPEKDMETFHREQLRNASEILEMKKAQAYGTKKSSNTSRKFSKEAMIACMEPLVENQQVPETVSVVEQSKEKVKPDRKKNNVDTKQDDTEVKIDAETQDIPKEHKIKSSIKKRSRKPSLTGKAKVALSFDTFIDTKEDKKPKEHSPQRSRLNNILDNLRTKNMERIQKLHDTDSAFEQPGPSYDNRPQYNIRYPSGSVVWAKMEESPWWPGMVDFCPDSEEYYWMEEGSAEPSWYHVVFFDKGEHVTRSWIRSEWIQIFDPEKSFDHLNLEEMDRSRLNDSRDMAINCLEKTRDQRLAKFSLATLFKGSWGKSPHPNKSPFHPLISDSWEPSFIDSSDPFSPIKLPKIPDDEESPGKPVFLDLDNKKVVDELGEDKEVNEAKVQDEADIFHCLMCEENVAFTKSAVSSHLKNHKVTLDDYPRIFVSHREDVDMMEIMTWIKEDEENSELLSDRVSPVTTDSLGTEETSASLSRNAFWKNQRDKFVKDKFQCDHCKKITKDKESLETHMKTHAESTSVLEDGTDIPGQADLKNDKALSILDQIQPVKDWINNKPAYFSGYSVVIKTKERRLANLELAFSNTPPPPPPKERVAQEPVLPSPRLSTHKSASHSTNRSKSSSNKRDGTTLVSKGMLKEYEHSRTSSSSSKRKGDETYKKHADPLRKKIVEKLKIENLNKTKTCEKMDNPKMTHSVAKLIGKPQEKTKSAELAGYEAEGTIIQETNLKEKQKTKTFENQEGSFDILSSANKEKQHENKPEAGITDKKLSDEQEKGNDNSEVKEDSPSKEAIDLSIKTNI